MQEKKMIGRNPAAAARAYQADEKRKASKEKRKARETEAIERKANRPTQHLKLKEIKQRIAGLVRAGRCSTERGDSWR